MARYEKTVALGDEAKRDAGKTFLIIEMPPRAAHAWAVKAFIELVNAGVEIPDNVPTTGVEITGDAQVNGMAALIGLSFSNLKQGINPDKANELLDDLMTCVKIIPDATKPNVRRNLIDSDIEEVTTFFRLEKEAFALHINFT